MIGTFVWIKKHSNVISHAVHSGFHDERGRTLLVPCRWEESVLCLLLNGYADF